MDRHLGKQIEGEIDRSGQTDAIDVQPTEEVGERDKQIYIYRQIRQADRERLKSVHSQTEVETFIFTDEQRDAYCRYSRSWKPFED